MVRVAVSRAPVGAGFHPRQASDGLAVYHVAHGPFPTRRRGRRPRRPFPSSTASPTTFLQPLVGAGFHPRPACVYHRHCGVARAAGGSAARKGGTPGEGPPFDPLLRFVSIRRVPRAAARGQGSAPGPRPLFCKKAGQKTFRRQSTSSPSPSPWRRVIQSVREADTLAAEWQLPREWERRAGPETSRGRHHPKAFFFGAPPRFFGQDQRNGVEQQHKVKPTASKTASSSKHKTQGRGGTPPLQKT